MSTAAHPTPPLLTLVIERSTCRPGWALFRDADCLLETISDEEPSRAPGWLARLGDALAKNHVSLAEVDRFAAGLGPGSFSGTRAAVAALQGMALPGGKPLTGVSSAAALAFDLLTARAARGLQTPMAVVGDARRERLWCAVYALEGPRLVVGSRKKSCGNLPPVCADRETFATTPPAHDAADFTLTPWADLPQHLPPGAVVISPDWDRIGTRLSDVLPAAQLVAGVCMPTAAGVGRLLLADPASARAEPAPIYLHPAVAEVRI
ncbi:MAG: tRNA (adenosine(37)-N6)-threonylcarbamoyltransferase complex dimerization subunit type 1 TsaB [bacterium]